jgi:glutaredoxin
MKLRLFYLPNCPHCKRAIAMLEELQASNPAYAAVEIEKINERVQSSLANQYDYYLVPTFYLGEKKLFEGVPTREAIEDVLKKAIEA